MNVKRDAENLKDAVDNTIAQRKKAQYKMIRNL